MRVCSFYVIHQLLLGAKVAGKETVIRAVVYKCFRIVYIAAPAGVRIQFFGMNDERNNTFHRQIINRGRALFTR
ncbi:hypothetical protein D3C72_2551210 [compost metagenome]